MRAAQTPWFGRPLAFCRSIPVAELSLASMSNVTAIIQEFQLRNPAIWLSMLASAAAAQKAGEMTRPPTAG